MIQDLLKSTFKIIANTIIPYKLCYKKVTNCTTVIPRFTVLLGGKQKCTVNRGKVNTCSIVKHDIGGTKKRRVISRDTINRARLIEG